MSRLCVDAVLFDLDGTLLDSAPDLAGAVNEMLRLRGRPALPLEELRAHGGSGARGMLGAAFGLAPGHEYYEGMKAEFLDLYERRMFEETRPFKGVQAVVDALDSAGLAWGIVTNKAVRFAQPLALALLPGARVLVGGDTTPHIKPHPAPLLEAANKLGVSPARCLYVGDDARDIAAGRAADMITAAAAWGYLGSGADISAWGANISLSCPDELLNRLELT